MARIIVFSSWDESLINLRGDMMLAMQQKGHEVIAMAPNAREWVRNELSKLNVKYLNVPLSRTGFNPIKDIFTVLYLYKLFKSKKPDILFSYNIKPIIYGSIAAKLAGVKKIYSMISGLGYVFSNKALKAKLINLVILPLYKLATRLNNGIIFQNQDNLSLFLEKNFVKSRRETCLVNGSGVNLDKFLPLPLPRETSFLFVGRFLVEKGVREYIEAAKTLKEQYPNIRFLLAGEIDSNPSSVSEEDLLGWQSKGIVSYLGYFRDIRDALAQSSVFVLPSYAEGMPRSVLEALATARPIITTDIPGCRPTIKEGYNGFLIPTKNVSVLVKKMEFFIKYPAKIEEMGLCSRNMAESKFSVKQVNRDILQFINL